MSERFPRTIGALERVFGFVERFVEANGLDAPITFTIQLAAEELFTNLVRHNPEGSGDIEIDLELSGGTLVVRLRDFDADPFEPAGATPAGIDLPLAERKVGGLGIHLVKSLFDTLRYEHNGRMLCVTAMKNLEASHV